MSVNISNAAKSRPRYIQVEAILHNLLETGGYRPGDKLPPEPELAQQIGVSRATLREALRSFEQQGIITRRQGVGTFVNARPLYIESGLETLESIEMLLRGRQLVPEVVERIAQAEKALPKAAQRLDLREGAPLTTVSTTYAVNGECVAYLMEVVSADLVTAEQMSAEARSMLDYLLAHPGRIELSYAVAHIAPVHGSETICAALHVGPQIPLFFIEQTVYDGGNQPRYYSRNYYVPAVFDFHLIRRVEATRG